MGIICFILVLGVTILVHEFGHYLFAKLSNTYVFEFSIGMGKKILSYKKKGGETEYNLRLIPIGGFVQLAGEDPKDENNIPKDRLLNNKKFYQKFLIMVAGAGFNFILALFALFLYGAIWGSPSLSTTIPNVVVDSPAYVAGLEAGDKIMKINGNNTYTIDDVQIYLFLAEEGATTFEIKRKDQTKLISVTPLEEKEAQEKGYSYGIEYSKKQDHGFLNAIKYSFAKTGAMFNQMFITIKSLFTGGVGMNDLSGPVGIYGIVDSARQAGFQYLLELIALLSINVGVINLLPFPAFDGGRILFTIIEKITGKKINPNVENIIHTIGFMLLMALMIYVTCNDILKLF